MFDHLLESSHRDDSNKWSNIGFGQVMKELASIEIRFTHLIWHSANINIAAGNDSKLRTRIHSTNDIFWV